MGRLRKANFIPHSNPSPEGARGLIRRKGERLPCEASVLQYDHDKKYHTV